MAGWNPWHGCTKYSEGCLNCYVYRIDARHGRDSKIITKNSDFYAPIEKKRDGSYKIKSGERVYTCFSSDFFHEQADNWRGEAWDMMRLRRDLNFFFITKRIERIYECLPPDWGSSGYPNVEIACTTENSRRAAERLPIYLAAPLRRRSIICEPLLEYVDLSPYLGGGVQLVLVGGESGNEARTCDYNWVLRMRDDCREFGVPFYFKQTGARFVKDGRLYRVPKHEQHRQAALAGINTEKE